MKFRIGFSIGFFFCYLMCSSSLVFGAEGDGSVVLSDVNAIMEWQKVDLEEKIQTKLIRAIDAIIPNHQFIVNPDILLRVKSTSEEVASNEKVSTEEDRVPLGKLDLDAPMVGSEEVNLFKNIKKVKVSLFLSNEVSDVKKESVKKIIKMVTASIGQSQPEIVVEQMDFVTEGTKKLHLEFKEPIGFIIIGLLMIAIFTFLTLFVFNGYKSIEARRLYFLEAQSARDEAQFQSKLGIEGEKSGDSREPSQGSSLQEGFVKFKALVHESSDLASELVRNWIKSPVKGASEALALLPQVLSTDECATVFKSLTLEDRKAWKKLLNIPLDRKDKSNAAHFVFSQIVGNLLVPRRNGDEDLKEMVSQLDMSDRLRIVQQDVQLGELLMNLLPSVEVDQLVSAMDAELAHQVTSASLNFSDDEIQDRSTQLKEVIQSLGNQQAS